jgi:RimJ/RimL family protein N-acetyltransferase
MSLQLTDDVELYAARVLPLLTERPDENTIALTVLDSVLQGLRFSDGPAFFGWHTDGDRITGAVSCTPPYGLLLAVAPNGSEGPLVKALRERGVSLPSVNSDADAAARFAEARVAGSNLAASVSMRNRFYSLASLVPLSPEPTGEPRRAEPTDLDLIMRWWDAFVVEAHAGPVAITREIFDRRIADGLLWLWNVNGTPVSFAGRNQTVAGVARVGPVYTPAEHRRRGYGAAATVACTQDALDRGAERVVLFTDLANPTSNAIYQQIGYRPVSDRVIIEFSE